MKCMLMLASLERCPLFDNSKTSRRWLLFPAGVQQQRPIRRLQSTVGHHQTDARHKIVECNGHSLLLAMLQSMLWLASVHDPGIPGCGGPCLIDVLLFNTSQPLCIALSVLSDRCSCATRQVIVFPLVSYFPPD